MKQKMTIFGKRIRKDIQTFFKNERTRDILEKNHVDKKKSKQLKKTEKKQIKKRSRKNEFQKI